jgi:hypothetical protein
MKTIQEICGINGYNYNSNHSQVYNTINQYIKKDGVKVLLQKMGTVNMHLDKPYNLTIKFGDQTLRQFHPMRKMLNRKKLGKLIIRGIQKLESNN